MVLIPTINTNNLFSFIKNLLIFRKKSILLQIDVFDGKYCQRKNYVNLFFLKLFKFNNQIEFHLMIKDIDLNLEKFLKFFPNRICVDFDEVKDFDFCYNLAKQYGVSLGIFVKGKKEIKVKTDFLVLMGVNPGISGQNLNETVFSDIDYYVSNYNFLIGVDGGVKENNILNFKEKGLDFVYAGSMIFNSVYPLKKFNEMQNLIK